MSHTPIDRWFDSVQWTPLLAPIAPGDHPYATHDGWLPLGEVSLHVFQLNTGERVIEAHSLETFLRQPEGSMLLFLMEHPEWEGDIRPAPEGLAGITPGELSATPAALRAFTAWAAEQGLVRHPERAKGLIDRMRYMEALDTQRRKGRQTKLRLLRPWPDQHGTIE